MSIIIVGNGSSILDGENGSKIDSYQTVVRFNSFKINGFEKYTGTKTNIWFTVNLAHKKAAHLFDKVIFHSWAKPERCNLYRKLKEIVPCRKIDFDLIDSIGVNCPSTGLIAIHYFLKEYDHVTITGFDWWARQKHHYGDNEVRGTSHNPKKEFDNIKLLIDQDKVRFL